MPGYHPVLVEQYMALLMEAVGVMATTADILTITTDLLGDMKGMITMREKAAETSCKEYLACKFLLLSNGERYKPLWTHLENGHTGGKKPHPTTVDGMKTLMVDYKAPGVTAPKATKKDEDNPGLAFAETQEWVNTKKTLTCFGYRKKGHALEDCKSTSKKEQQKIHETKRLGFRKDDSSTASSTRAKAKKTAGVINQAVTSRHTSST